MKYGTLVVLGLVIASSTIQSQAPELKRLVTLRSVSGRYVPMGLQKRDFRSAPTHGIQAALELAPFLRLVGATSWTDGESRNIVMRGFPRMRLWQYDAGAEFLSQNVAMGPVDVRPFVGIGAGARNYYYLDKGMTSIGYPAGYYALGAELQAGHLGLRVEGRTYLSIYHTPLEANQSYRDDATVTFGLSYRVF
jgi:hypothetical protein